MDNAPKYTTRIEKEEGLHRGWDRPDFREASPWIKQGIRDAHDLHEANGDTFDWDIEIDTDDPLRGYASATVPAVCRGHWIMIDITYERQSGDLYASESGRALGNTEQCCWLGGVAHEAHELLEFEIEEHFREKAAIEEEERHLTNLALRWQASGW